MEKTDKKFRKEAGHRLRNTSLLHQFDILKDIENNEILLNIWKSYSIPDDIKNNQDYVFKYMVPDDEWWDTIAYDVYENENLWWIIALTNDVVNPFEEPNPGEEIRVLDDALLYRIIKEVRNISEL